MFSWVTRIKVEKRQYGVMVKKHGVKEDPHVENCDSVSSLISDSPEHPG